MPCRLLHALNQFFAKLTHVRVLAFAPRSAFRNRRQLSNGLLFFRRQVHRPPDDEV
jgi:hypothetical protein